MDHSYAVSLEAKHAGLEQQILEERQRPHPDDDLLTRLKKEKLRIKETLSGLTH